MASVAVLDREAMAAARRVRIRANLHADSPICIYDLIDNHYRDEIELRFKALPSLEGLYVRGEPDIGCPAIIIVSSLRPSGRQRLTCAHELGHHVFGHGDSLDKIMEEGKSERFEPNEYLAYSFASFLTMPKLGIMKAFAERKIKVEAASAHDVFTVASQFGVGFTTLLKHLSQTLRVLPEESAARLRRVTPKRLREELLGKVVPGELLIVDGHWSGRAIDLAKGDHVVLPFGSRLEGDVLAHVERRPMGEVYRAQRVGRGRVEDASTGMSAYLRVSPFPYNGRAMFRHQEECENDCAEEAPHE